MPKKAKNEKLKPSKITADQLEALQGSIKVINKLQMEIGSLELQKQAMMPQVEGAREFLSTIQMELEKSYGVVNIDINTGSISPRE